MYVPLSMGSLPSSYYTTAKAPGRGRKPPAKSDSTAADGDGGLAKGNDGPQSSNAEPAGAGDVDTLAGDRGNSSARSQNMTGSTTTSPAKAGGELFTECSARVEPAN